MICFSSQLTLTALNEFHKIEITHQVLNQFVELPVLIAWGPVQVGRYHIYHGFSTLGGERSKRRIMAHPIRSMLSFNLFNRFALCVSESA